LGPIESQAERRRGGDSAADCGQKMASIHGCLLNGFYCRRGVSVITYHKHHLGAWFRRIISSAQTTHRAISIREIFPFDIDQVPVIRIVGRSCGEDFDVSKNQAQENVQKGLSRICISPITMIDNVTTLSTSCRSGSWKLIVLGPPACLNEPMPARPGCSCPQSSSRSLPNVPRRLQVSELQHCPKSRPCL
jgi:hypothetical protein